MKSLFTAWWMLGLMSPRNHGMDDIYFGGGWLDRSSRHALQILLPRLAIAEAPIPESPIREDVPVPKPFDVPVPSPMDVPPPEPRDIPPPKLPRPEIDPKPKTRPIS